MRRNKTYLFFFILVLCFVFLILLFGKERREGDYMPADEAENLTCILAETAEIPFQMKICSIFLRLLKMYIWIAENSLMTLRVFFLKMI